MEVLHNDAGLLLYGFRLRLHKGTEFLRCLLFVELGIILHSLDNLVETVIGSIVGQDVHDKSLFDGLFHGIFVEGPMLRLPVRFLIGRAKHLQRLVLGCCRKSIVVGILHHLSAFYDFGQPVFQVLLITTGITTQRDVHLCTQRTVLARVCLVDDNAKTLMLQFRADGIQNKGELMHDGDNNLLATCQMIPQRLSAVGPSHQVLQPFECHDIVSDLSVQIHTVGNNNHTIQQCLRAIQQAHQLIGQPSDGV